MEERDRQRDQSHIPGPVITISREHGCDATPIALRIIHSIEEMKASKRPWKYINKQVLEDAARELHVSVQKIRSAMAPGPESVVDDLFSSFSQHYVATEKVLETLHDVITLYAHQGNVIIVGRGGASITQRIPHALHIRLIAPLDWRAKQVSTKRSIPIDKARELCIEMDGKRSKWFEKLIHAEHNDSYYDLILNRKTLTEDQILDIIFYTLAQRQMIKVSNEKIPVLQH